MLGCLRCERSVLTVDVASSSYYTGQKETPVIGPVCLEWSTMKCGETNIWSLWQLIGLKALYSGYYVEEYLDKVARFHLTCLEGYLM